MIILKDKLQDIYNRLSSLLSELETMGVNNFYDLPDQINKISAGENKLSQQVDGTIQEITENDLKGITTIGSYAFYDCKNLTSVIIPEGITAINYYAFYGCINLTNITIPSSVTTIVNYAFYDCSNLTVYLYSTIPPIIETSSFSKTTVVHVPIGCGDIYKNNDNWSHFSDCIIDDIVIESQY